MRAKALASVLSQKLVGHLVFVDALAFATPKTADARKFLTALGAIEGKKDIGTRRRTLHSSFFQVAMTG